MSRSIRSRRSADRFAMTEEREIIIEGKSYTIVISDEKEALLAAKAAGRALLGLQSEENEELWPASYVAESFNDLDPEYLEQVVRRCHGMPWRIGETKRLLIREFQAGDAGKVLREETDTREDEVFYTPEKLSEYIRCQYGFYEYGLWALIEKETGKLIGKAGIVQVNSGQEPWESEMQTDETGAEQRVKKSKNRLYVEIGYHIFKPYRRRGYALEACRKIIELVKEKAQTPVCIYAKIDASNEASIETAKSCGLSYVIQKCNEAGQWMYHGSDCWK